ncbi:MAG TPA: lycopene cyclase domain-containing protein [Anaerolineae bacterium]|nr:lycopene cyclase domain-containing protein [Anaerolineae bacterium]
MTYFGFLLRFLVIPILILLWLTWRDRGRGMHGFTTPGSRIAWITLGSLILIALVYTTPWDNYLVATGVWGYNPALVTGITLGWVPLEEYLFFILQPIMTGLWTLYLIRHLSRQSSVSTALPHFRWISTAVLAGLWLVAVTILIANWQPGVYLALQLVWALPPLMLQLGVGADVLWRRRLVALLAILSTTFYLSAADWLAIRAGIWTINPEQSFNLFLGQYLPVEEFIFFLLTNTLVVFGLLLGLATESWPQLTARLKSLAAFQ